MGERSSRSYEFGLDHGPIPCFGIVVSYSKNGSVGRDQVGGQVDQELLEESIRYIFQFHEKKINEYSSVFHDIFFAAVCMLIRIACKMIEEEEGKESTPYFEFIESCLRHKSEMVIYEAAHAIVNLKQTTSRELIPAISVLQLFCSSPKATLRFAAVRTLNQVSMTHPAAVTACNLDLENLITDSNRSIATLAITTLLKTGAESSVDRLMKQIATFVNEISDEFKVVVVQAIKSLCLKFPKKHGILLNFLSRYIDIHNFSLKNVF